ncbi:MAG: AsmA-like C-terminal region-containing protein [Hyphomicrobiaceae bacterium]
MLLTTLIGLGIAAPLIISISSDHITVSSSRLLAAPRDSVMISSPAPLGQSKLLTIERGLLYPADSAGRALETPLTRPQLASGNTRFVLENATLRIQSGSLEAGEGNSAALIEAISAMQFESLSLRKATVHVLLPDGRTETMTDIDGEISHRRKATLFVKGKGDLRGQRVKFDLSSGLLTDARPGSTVPLKLSFQSSLIEASFEGRVGLVGPVQLQGSIEFTAQGIRQIARWFGSPWPAGNELRNLSGQGQLAWAGPAMAFNKGAFQLDGNQATGTLHLNFANARPSIGGTLALKSLDLGRYFPSRAAPLPLIAGNTWKNLLTTDLTLPLAQHFDVDLRISSDKVLLGNLQFGRAAAAVTVSQGRMLADIGAFEFDGGRGNGQISADMSGSIPKLTLRGRLDEIDATRISTSLFGHPVLTGRATITTDLASTGRTGDDLMASSQGKLNIAIRAGGRLGVDVRGLATSTQKRTADGWGSAGRGQTTFDTLDAVFAVRAGALIADNVSAKSGDITTAISGQIDMPTSRLNLSIVQSPTATSAVATPTATPAKSGPTIQIFGPWSAPTVRNDGNRERAADPTRPADGGPARL